MLEAANRQHLLNDAVSHGVTGRQPGRAVTQVRRVSLHLQSRAAARGLGSAAASPMVATVGARVSARAAEA